MPRKIKSLSCMCNGISGRGDAPEYDLVPVNPNRPQGGEDPPPIRLPSERASQQGAPERLLRGHGESGHRRPPPCLLSQGALEEEMGTVLWTPATKRATYWRIWKHAMSRHPGHKSPPYKKPSEDSNLQRDVSLPDQPTSLCNVYVFRGRQYTALTVNRDCHQTHASMVASRGRMSTRWDCNLRNSASR